MLDFVAKLERWIPLMLRSVIIYELGLNVLRDDKVEQVLTQEQALQNAL